MRILNNDTDSPLKNLSVYLTLSEAQQMLGYLEQIVDEPNQHYHLNDVDYEREITLAVYNPDDLSGFNVRSKNLIQHDE